MSELTRGERNNNPGNIRHGDSWQGLAAAQTDKSFCTFTDVKFGIRAIAKIMLSYRNQGNVTCAAIISKWAPPNENNTTAYVQAVAANIDVEPTAVIDVRSYDTMMPLVTAIIKHENGRVQATQQQIDEGLALAGIAA